MKGSKTFWIVASVIMLLGVSTAYVVSSPFGDFLKDQWMGSRIQRILTQPLLHLGRVPITLAFLVETTLFFLLLGIVTGQVRRLLQKWLLSHGSLDAGQQYAYSRIASYVFFLIGLIVGLQTAGVNLSSVLVVGGAVGIGVGLGLQSLANNFVSGLVLLFERPIKLGDRVEVGGVLGDIVRIAGRSTWVRTNENVVIIVPNSEFITHRVINWTANDRSVRFSLPVGVSYGSNPSEVRDILLATAREHADILDDPSPDVLFLGFGDSSLNFELRVWTVRHVQTPKILASDLYFTIFDNFRKQRIEIPFPQRDLHLRSVSLSIPMTST